MRLIRGYRLLAIDPSRVAETYDAKNAPDEKRTNKARQIVALVYVVARETGHTAKIFYSHAIIMGYTMIEPTHAARN
jgi:hypothetical protein